MSLTREQLRLRSKIALITRYQPENVQVIEEAKRDLRVSRAEDYLRELLAATPPPTTEQRARLATQLLAAFQGESRGAHVDPEPETHSKENCARKE